MKTYSPRKAELQSSWHLVDASGETLGRLASRVAQLLRGKDNVRYAPHMDCGDYVVVVNAAKVLVTGKKAQQKVYYRHSGYPGGFKTITYAEMMKRHPERIIEHAVKGMLPKTALGRAMYGKLRVYRGPAHPHAGQLRPAAPAAEERPPAGSGAAQPAPAAPPSAERQVAQAQPGPSGPAAPTTEERG